MSNPFAVYSPPNIQHSQSVTQQPIATAPLQPDVPVLSQNGWLPPSTTFPRGLEYLIALDYLFVNKNIEMKQVSTESKNRYTITDIKNKTVFYVTEESKLYSRLCLGSYRSCEFSILDRDSREVLRMIRPFRCNSCCCPCYLQILEVYSENVLLGSVTQEWNLWQPTFSIRDASGKPVLIIKGPIIRFCIDITFKVQSLDEKHNIGIIQNQWSCFIQEFHTVSDMFGINFPRDLDVKIKAILLGACLLIDFMYFDNKG